VCLGDGNSPRADEPLRMWVIFNRHVTATLLECRSAATEHAHMAWRSRSAGNRLSQRARVRVPAAIRETRRQRADRLASNSSQVAEALMAPRTYLHEPTVSRGNIHWQARHENSGLDAGL
jgi:hypothetical protein